MTTTKKTRATASSLPMMSQCSNYESDNSGPMPHAEFGSRFHKAVEEGDLRILLTDEALTLGREVGKTQGQSESAFAWAMDYLKILGPGCHEVKGQCKLLPGRNFYIDYMVGSDDGKSVIVVDWKSSRNLDNYQADSCEQGWLYVAAVFELAPTAEEVTMVFAAPYCEDDDEYKVSQFTYTRDDQHWLDQQIALITHGADDPDSAPSACSYCTWCKHYKTCAETTSIIAPAMEDRFGKVLDRAMKSPILMSKLRDCVPVLEQVVKDIKASANDMYFERGTVVPGYNPVEMKGRTTVTDPGAMILALSEQFDVDLEALAAYLKIDLKGMETVIRNAVPRGEGAKTIEQFRETCDRSGWTKTGSGSVYLKKSKQKKEISG